MGNHGATSGSGCLLDTALLDAAAAVSHRMEREVVFEVAGPAFDTLRAGVASNLAAQQQQQQQHAHPGVASATEPEPEPELAPDALERAATLLNDRMVREWFQRWYPTHRVQRTEAFADVVYVTARVAVTEGVAIEIEIDVVEMEELRARPVDKQSAYRDGPTVRGGHDPPGSMTRPSSSKTTQPSSKTTQLSSKTTASSGTEESSGDSWMTLDRLWQLSSPVPSPVSSTMRPTSGTGHARTASAAARRSLSVHIPSPGAGGGGAASFPLASPYAAAATASPSRSAIDEFQWPSSRSSAVSIGSAIPSPSPSSAEHRAWATAVPLQQTYSQLELVEGSVDESSPDWWAANGYSLPVPAPAPVPAPEAPPRPKMADSDSMMIALARVHGAFAGHFPINLPSF